MSKPVIAVHSVIRVPAGKKVQETVNPGEGFTPNDDAELDYLLGVGAVRLDESEKPAKAEKAPKPSKGQKPAEGDKTDGDDLV